MTETEMVGAVGTKPGEFPFMASLRLPDTGLHFCGGVLIRKSIVLTSATCAIATSNFEVHIGRYNRLGDDAGRFEPFKATEKLIHPLYDSRPIDYDIALLVLDGESGIKPMDFVKSEEDLAGETTGLLLGWDLVVPGNPSTQGGSLLQVDVPLVSREECRILYGDATLITESMICAGEEGKDACHSDSGSPLLVDGKVAGTVSWGIGCGGEMPGVYASIGAVADWIESQI